MGARSFLGVKCGQGVALTTHALLAPRSWKSRALPLPPLWATTVPTTGLLYIYSVVVRTYALLFLISNFCHVLNVVCFHLGNFPAPEFYMPTFRNTLSVPSS